MERMRLEVGERAVEVEVYVPEASGPAPGILLLHELYGMRDWYREDAADLASRGYLVYVPALYTGIGVLRYCIRAAVLEAGRHNRADSQLNQEVHRLLDSLKADPRCNGHLGMLGACLTGGFVLQMARRPDMLAPVVYHHAFGTKGAGILEEDSLESVQRLQGHYAQSDWLCPAARRTRLKERLGDRLEAHVYDMPHGFRSFSRSRPDSALVWSRTVAFFDTHLKGALAPAQAAGA
jgi:carboxymethylenebutenolidase